MNTDHHGYPYEQLIGNFVESHEHRQNLITLLAHESLKANPDRIAYTEITFR